jgi:hypothetical protein
MLLAVVREMTDPVFEPEPEEAPRDIGTEEVREGDISARLSLEGFGVIVEGADDDEDERVWEGENLRRPFDRVSSSSSSSSSCSSPSVSSCSNLCLNELKLVAFLPSILKV